MRTPADMMKGKFIEPQSDFTDAELAYTEEERAAVDEKEAAVKAREKAQAKVGAALKKVRSAKGDGHQILVNAQGRYMAASGETPKKTRELLDELSAAQDELQKANEREREARIRVSHYLRQRTRRLQALSIDRQKGAR